MRKMIRGIIDTVVEGAIKRISIKGFSGESIDDREYFQHYGYTSRPLNGAECIVIREGNHLVVIASDDRRYRIALEEGEVALYTDEGDKVHLKRGKEILIQSGNKVTVEAANEISGTAPVVTVNAATSCTVNSPAINLGGARAGLRRFVDERFATLFGSHTHGGVQAGSDSSGTPNQSFVQADNCTDTTRGI
ncbi:MAG: phage baseplate assembly protein [Desulfobulbaceae bacterium]|nr:phage baseplate assembly protein [Desulfobulbaceae bacterium]